MRKNSEITATARKKPASPERPKTAPKKGEFDFALFILGYHLRNHRKDTTPTGKARIRIAIETLKACQEIKLFYLPVSGKKPEIYLLGGYACRKLARKIAQARKLCPQVPE